MGYRVAAHVNGAHQVDLRASLPVVVTGFDDASAAPTAHVIVQHVKCTVPLYRRFRRTSAVLRLGDVCDHRNGRSALGLDPDASRLCPFQDGVHQYHSGPFPCHENRGSRAVADALASVGTGSAYDRHFAVKSQVCSSVHSAPR